jgi:hypothetical protein
MLAMRRKHACAAWAMAALLVLASAVLMTCADKVVRSRSAHSSIRIQTELAPSAIASLSIRLFRMTVSGPNMDTVRAFLHVTSTAGMLEGTAEIPYGIDRKLVIEADIVKCLQEAAICDTIPLFSGETTTDVVPGSPLDVDVQLTPVVPMMRLSPKYVSVALYESFEIDVVAYNIDSLNEIIGHFMRTDSNSYIIYFDSLVRPSDVNSSRTLASEYSWFYYWRDTSHTPILKHGNTGRLVRAFLTISDVGVGAQVQSGLRSLSISLASMYKLNGDSIPVSSIYIDDALIDVH